MVELVDTKDFGIKNPHILIMIRVKYTKELLEEKV